MTNVCHMQMAEQQPLGQQRSENNDAGLLPRVPRNASVTSLHSMGGDPIWNTTQGEIEALNHWRPEQVSLLVTRWTSALRRHILATRSASICQPSDW